MNSKEILFRKVGEKYIPVSDGEWVVSVEKVKNSFKTIIETVFDEYGIDADYDTVCSYYYRFYNILSE